MLIILLVALFGALHHATNGNNITWRTSIELTDEDSTHSSSSEETNNDRSGPEKRFNCSAWEYQPGQYRKLENGSIAIQDSVVDHIEHIFIGDILYVCEDEEYPDYEEGVRSNISILSSPSPFVPDPVSLVFIGNIGCGLSIFSLILYLMVFSFIRELHNLPGCNLTSMCVSLLLGYSFFLVAQIPQVLDISCVVVAVLHHHFFLVSFFWMNVISYDVWRTLRNATQKLLIHSGKVTLRFLFYSLYGWGVPLAFTIAAVAADQHPDSPKYLRPAFGEGDLCMYNGAYAKKVFFVAPATAVFITNFILFKFSIIMVVQNRMRDASGNNGVAKKNFMLYSRLGVMTGITWITGIISAFATEKAFSYVFNLLNSTQGIFIFVLFCCTEKVWKYGNKRLSKKRFISYMKNTTSETVSSQPT